MAIIHRNENGWSKTTYNYKDDARKTTLSQRQQTHESTCRKGRAKSNYPKLVAARMVGAVGEQ